MFAHLGFNLQNGPGNQMRKNDSAFLQLIQVATDSDLSEWVFLRCLEVFGADMDVSRVPTEVATIVLVCRTSGFVNSAGFEALLVQKYHGDPFFELTAEQYRKIGLLRSHQALQRLFSLFPNNRPSRSVTTRVKVWRNYDASERDKAEMLFFADFNDRLDIKSLATFIRENKEQLLAVL